MQRILKFSDYKCSLLNNEILLKLQQRFKSEARNVYTEKIQTFDNITSYPYAASTAEICKTEMLTYLNIK